MIRSIAAMLVILSSQAMSEEFYLLGEGSSVVKIPSNYVAGNNPLRLTEFNPVLIETHPVPTPSVFPDDVPHQVVTPSAPVAQPSYSYSCDSCEDECCEGCDGDIYCGPRHVDGWYPFECLHRYCNNFNCYRRWKSRSYLDTHEAFDDTYFRFMPYYDSREGAHVNIWTRTSVFERVTHFSNSFARESMGSTSLELGEWETIQSLYYHMATLPFDIAGQYIEYNDDDYVARGGIGIRIHDLFRTSHLWEHNTYFYFWDNQANSNTRVEHYGHLWLTDCMVLRSYADHEINGEFDLVGTMHADIWLGGPLFLSVGGRYDSFDPNGDHLGYQVGFRIDLNFNRKN